MLNIHESLSPEKIKSIREEMGLTQRELAEKLCVHGVTICRWETGQGSPRRIYQERLIQLYNDFLDDKQIKLEIF